MCVCVCVRVCVCVCEIFPFNSSPIGWASKIHRLYLCRELRVHQRVS